MSGLFVKVSAAAVFSVFLAVTAYGQTNDPLVQKREQRQEKRIDQGVQSGELNPREAGRLEREQARIKQDEERMKADGKLTPQERRKLRREQNRASRHIYREKHDAQQAR
jgi:hypothetical protein